MILKDINRTGTALTQRAKAKRQSISGPDLLFDRDQAGKLGVEQGERPSSFGWLRPDQADAEWRRQLVRSRPPRLASKMLLQQCYVATVRAKHRIEHIPDHGNHTKTAVDRDVE